MKTIYGFLIMIFMTMNIFGQAQEHDRDPVVAGSFYPAGKAELKRQLEHYFRDAAGKASPGPGSDGRVRAIISPHAGYVFSGTVAASAVGCIAPGSRYENIFLIGSSHRVSFTGASVYTDGNYRTPLGTVKVNTGLAKALTESSDFFSFRRSAHTGEHSLEVQLPFLQYHLGNDIQIVPIIIGTQNSKICGELAEALLPYFTGDNLFVISSDFSHYPSFEDALKIDKLTAEALMTGDPGGFLETLRKNSDMKIKGLATSMCGWTSGLVLLHLAKKEPGLEFMHILYENSGHSNMGDKSGVVGYHSLALVEKNRSAEGRNGKSHNGYKKAGGSNPGNDEAGGKHKDNYEAGENNSTGDMLDFSISHQDQISLIEIARQSIWSHLHKEKSTDYGKKELSPALLSELGAFVTLNIDGQLRGCIGCFMPSAPLYKTVGSMAREAAFMDPRFSPLSRDEFEKINIEISVLSPLRKISNIEEITLGKHGVYIKKGTRSGTFLPQVADSRDWTLNDFLGHISRDKAGLGWTGWKDAEIYVYEAFVFGEE
ncbi:MAG: AmmeMemoRadiSam system protein B [Bacteroidales bacterium]|jgi:AmmeMemoRadiSam system protein B/AmmeMemoRadiSam system protein A|nr:AmmeMemoRadiSam system protein B [Bacteroidales bacterium]